MKIRIELDESILEEEVIIRCASISDRIQKLQKAISDADHMENEMQFFKGDTQYYLRLENILFFETDGGCINVHTCDEIFQTKLKLYELEEMLPGYFMRISKSAILNTKKVYAINRNLTASSVVEFQDTFKKVYVSRNFYKPLIQKLEEKRLHYDR